MNGNAIDVTGVHQKFNDALTLACSMALNLHLLIL